MASHASACAWTPATCWPRAMTSAREPGVDAVMAEFEQRVGRERLGCLHLNDSVTPLGSNRDRHANIGEGELGSGGCAAFLAAPQFDGLPCVLETPGAGKGKGGPTREEVTLARKLRTRRAGGQAASSPPLKLLRRWRPPASPRARSRGLTAGRACGAHGRRCPVAPAESRASCGCRAVPRPARGTPRSPASVPPASPPKASRPTRRGGAAWLRRHLRRPWPSRAPARGRAPAGPGRRASTV